ncbi:hypothetical protein TNCV_4593901 [Trichonephila clavipes]|uniref:Uncharacterized protein n=1 Tax=Trichonephila clavipes TaxID=2585209 RepID=A0A8X7BJQ0_TRICX|nr:hypothetical protein TNCV_4593901 [Trichonephila clavipes]
MFEDHCYREAAYRNISSEFVASTPPRVAALYLEKKPVSIETESLKCNDMGFIRGPVNVGNKYPSDPLINIR